MLSQPIWGASSPDHHRSARSGRQRRRDTQHAETPHTTVISELGQYPIAIYLFTSAWSRYIPILENGPPTEASVSLMPTFGSRVSDIVAMT